MTVRLLATTRAGRLHDEELQAMEGTWRGAATTISRKAGFFVDRNRASFGGSLPSSPDAGSAKNATSGVGPSAAPATERATPATIGEGGKDTRAAEAGMLQSQGPALLRESFLARAGAAGLKAQEYDGEGFDQLPAAGLIIEGEFVTIAPGSRVKRYWVGFGAGKSAIETAGRIMTPSGDIVAEFWHRRIGAMGMGGGEPVVGIGHHGREREAGGPHLACWRQGDVLFLAKAHRVRNAGCGPFFRLHAIPAAGTTRK